MEASQFRETVLAWLDTLRWPEGPYGRYRLTTSAGEGSPACASAFAALTREILDDLTALTTAQREEWVAYLQGFQEPATGYFREPTAPKGNEEEPPARLKVEGACLTLLCASALRALGAEPRYPLHYVRPFRALDDLNEWFDQQAERETEQWSAAVYALGGALCLDAVQTGHPQTRLALGYWFGRVDAALNPQTGWWGCTSKAVSPALRSAYPLYLLYAYFHRELPLRPRTVEEVLNLQNEAGLFAHPQGEEVFTDLAAVHTLVLEGERGESRRADIVSALQRVWPALLRQQREDGGFGGPPGLVGGELREEVGLPSLAESNLPATCLRVFTLAVLSRLVTDIPLATLPWQFNENPGLFYHPPRRNP